MNAKAITGGIELRRHAVIDGDPLAVGDDGTRVVHILRRGPLFRTRHMLGRAGWQQHAVRL